MLHRQQAIGLLLQPLLSLLMLARRTVAITTRPSDPVLATTAAAFEDHRSKFSRATARDGAEHLPLLQGDLA
jgi:hypothetical protein